MKLDFKFHRSCPREVNKKQKRFQFTAFFVSCHHAAILGVAISRIIAFSVIPG
jgi:hypothetical protein